MQVMPGLLDRARRTRDDATEPLSLISVREPVRTYRVSPVKPVSARDLRGWWIPDAAFAALRVFIAAMIARHGLQDHFGILLLGDDVWLGTPAALTDRWLAATLLIAGGLLLGVGLFTRAAALLLALVTVLGWFAAGRVAGHWMVDGREPIALYAAVLLLFTVIGPGLFALDTLWKSRGRRKRGVASTVGISPWLARQYRRRELTR
jgi:putative oxidoreductase